LSFVASEEAILEGARGATGFADFGGGAWRDHFRTLLRAYDEESRLTEAGRQMVLGEIGGVLAARLACEAAWKRDPSVLRHEIQPGLLAADAGLRSMTGQDRGAVLQCRQASE